MRIILQLHVASPRVQPGSEAAGEDVDAQRAQQGQAQQAARKAGGGGVQGGNDEDPRVKFEPDSPAAQARGGAAAAAARCVVGQPGQVADGQAAVGGRVHADLRAGGGWWSGV